MHYLRMFTNTIGTARQKGDIHSIFSLSLSFFVYKKICALEALPAFGEGLPESESNMTTNYTIEPTDHK